MTAINLAPVKAKHLIRERRSWLRDPFAMVAGAMRLAAAIYSHARRRYAKAMLCRTAEKRITMINRRAGRGGVGACRKL
jgi:hypothetical protein